MNTLTFTVYGKTAAEIDRRTTEILADFLNEPHQEIADWVTQWHAEPYVMEHPGKPVSYKAEVTATRKPLK